MYACLQPYIISKSAITSFSGLAMCSCNERKEFGNIYNYQEWITLFLKFITLVAHLDTIFQLFFSLWIVVDCSPLTIAFREEKFFTALQLWAMSIQWLMTLPRPSAATPPRMVAMTTRETRLKCSIQERTVGALSMSFGLWTYSRHWWSTTLRKRSYVCVCVCVCVCACKNFNEYFSNVDGQLLEEDDPVCMHVKKLLAVFFFLMHAVMSSSQQ